MRLTLLALCIWVLAGCDGPNRRPLPGLSFGVNSSLEWWGGTLDESRWRLREFEAAKLAPPGGIVRMAFRRGEMEIQPGDYDFTWHDRSVDLFRSKGINVLGVLIGSTPWTLTAPVADLSQMGFYPPDDPSEFGRYVAEVVSHFKGRVAFWEIWNEPNILFFWSPTPDATRYASLLRESIRSIRSADPAAQVISGAMAPAPSLPPLSYSDAEFLDAVLSADPDLSRDLDGIGIHNYGLYPPQDPPEENGADYRAQVRRLREVLKRRAADELPLWATEFGFCSHDRLTLNAQGDYLARAALLLAAEGVDVLIPWVLLDHGPGFRTFASIGTFECERFFGMLKDTDPATDPPAAEKPAYRAWSDLARDLTRARFDSGTSALFTDPTLSTFRFSRNTEEVLIAYRADGESEIEAPRRVGDTTLKEVHALGGEQFDPTDAGKGVHTRIGSTPVVFIYR
ncbi:MAG: hypothetical protein HYT87_14245 [Nitrospirae bacterium]|nr:hypothetical protein [Nitrospirota bacterium]